MSITFKKNFDLNKIADQGLNNLARELERGLLSARTEISERTRAGRTTEGASMQPYAESTRKQKARAGKSTTPNLTETGGMLRGMQVKIDRIATGLLGRIFFLGSESQKARIHQLGTDKVPERPFFGLSREQLRRLTERLRKAFK